MTKDDLRAWRKRMGLSQRKAALEIGVHWRTIQGYEAGDYPVPRYIELACKALENEQD